MGRPSVLSEPMKVDIGRRLAAGESLHGVSRDTGIAYTTLRRNFSDQVPKIREVAQTLAQAEMQMARLPVSAQCAVRGLADQLKSIHDHYTMATDRSTRTAVKFSNLAGSIADAIPDDLTGPEAVASSVLVTELTKTMNLALQPAANMIQASKSQLAAEPAEHFGADQIVRMAEEIRRGKK